MNATYHTPAQAADFFGLSKKTILRAIKTGELAAIKYNSKVFRIMSVDGAAWYAAKGGRLKNVRK